MKHYRDTLRLGFPIAIGQLGTIVLTFADTIMVGQYGTPELAAASFVNSIFNLVTMIVLGYSYGITPLVAAHEGRGERSAAGAVLRRGIVANFRFGTALLIVFGLLYFVLEHLGQPPHLLPLLRPYYLTMWGSMWFVVLFNVVRQFMDGTTDTRTPMWILLGGNAVNIGLNALLIFGLGGFPEWGLMGAGMATLISRILVAGAALAIVLWSKRYAPYRQPMAEEQRESPLANIGEIHRKSWPVSAQLGLETFAFTFSAVMAGWLGELELAAYQILLALGTLGFTLYYSFASAMSIRMAQFLAQSDMPQAQAACRAGRNVLLGNATLSSLIFWLGGGSLISLFTPDSEVVAIAVALIPALVLYQYADALQITFANALRATGCVLPMTGVAFVAYMAVGVPSAWVLGFGVGWGLMGIYLSFTLCLLVAAVLFHHFFRRTLLRPLAF